MPSDTKISQLTTVTLEAADMIPIVDATTGENRKVLAGSLASVLTTTAATAAYQPLDGDLTSLAGASGTNTIYYRSAADTWSAVTIGSNLSFSGGTLSASGSSPAATTSGRVVLANGASTTVTHSADASNLRRARFHEYIVTGTTDNPVWFQADFEGANDATSYNDQSAYLRTITFNGGAKISTAQFKNGSSSLLLPASGSYLTIPSACFAFGTNNFTVEFWIRFITLPSNSTGPTDYQNVMTIFDSRPAGTNGNYAALSAITTAGVTNLAFDQNGTTRIQSSSISANTWIHVAIVRNGGTTAMYLGGTSQGTWSDSTNYIASQGLIGRNANEAAAPSIKDADFYMDDLRINGTTAVYTSGFTPPASAHAAPTYTVTLQPRAESAVAIRFDDGAGANRTTKTTATNSSGGTLQGELVVIQ